MGMGDKSGSVFLVAAGAVLGGLAVYGLTRNNARLKPLLTGLVAEGLNIKDRVLGVVDQAREGLEDLMVEAENARGGADAAAGESKGS